MSSRLYIAPTEAIHQAIHQAEQKGLLKRNVETGYYEMTEEGILLFCELLKEIESDRSNNEQES